MLHPRENHDLYGHLEIELQFIKASQSGKLHHAWILTGEQGIGKATFAYHAAKFLLSSPQANLNKLSGGWDEQVAAKVNALSHPDLYSIESDHEIKGSGDIKIDAVRELSQFCNMTPVLAKYKVVIIDSINDLNTHSSNAILKQLEEPHPSTIFLLVCHSLGSLLPTIRSRCRLAKFNILKKPDFLTVLEDQNVHIEDNLYEVCHGSLYLAKMLAKDNNFHLYNEVYDLLSGKLDLQEKTKLIHKLADEKLWNLTGNLIELIIFKIAKEHKNLPTQKFKLLERAKKLLYNSNRFHLDRIQTLTLISQNSYV